MNLKAQSRRMRSGAGNGGFTLIELLIAISLMLILTLVLTQIFNSTVDIFTRSQQQVMIYSNQKAFIELLTRELNNILPVAATGQSENALRIYSPTDQMIEEHDRDFPHKSGGSSLCTYANSYYGWDINYQPGYGNAWPDEIDLEGSRLSYAPDSESAEKFWSAPLLAFATNTSFVAEGQRIIAPAWVEYFLAKAKVETDGIERTYFYLKRRLMRLQAVMPGDTTYTSLSPPHSKLVGPVSRVEPFVERPWREEIYQDSETGRGSMDGDVVLEFFPRIKTFSDDFEDMADAFKIEFYIYNAAADGGNGGFAWVRPDEDFGEAVFTVSMDNPVNGTSPTSTLPRPSRTLSSSSETANFYPDTLRNETDSTGASVLYHSETPIAIRITALLGHERSSPLTGFADTAREHYSTDDVPPRTFSHTFWLPTAPASVLAR